MSPEETEIFEFLKRYRPNFVSVTEISRSVGNRKRFFKDRYWARPLLRRMEVDGWVESNEFGEYRVILRDEDTTSFYKALGQPDIALGETTIIEIDDVVETETTP